MFLNFFGAATHLLAPLVKRHKQNLKNKSVVWDTLNDYDDLCPRKMMTIMIIDNDHVRL